jgi:hypothetical protein
MAQSSNDRLGLAQSQGDVSKQYHFLLEHPPWPVLRTHLERTLQRKISPEVHSKIDETYAV